jgi:hypothetical protein
VPVPDPQRDAEYRQVFRPFSTVAEFRASLNLCPLGKTGRLTTVDELMAMTDQQLEPFLQIANLKTSPGAGTRDQQGGAVLGTRPLPASQYCPKAPTLWSWVDAFEEQPNPLWHP